MGELEDVGVDLGIELETLVAGSGHSAVRVKGNRLVVCGGLHDKKFLHDLHVLDIGTVQCRLALLYYESDVSNALLFD